MQREKRGNSQAQGGACCMVVPRVGETFASSSDPAQGE